MMFRNAIVLAVTTFAIVNAQYDESNLETSETIFREDIFFPGSALDTEWDQIFHLRRNLQQACVPTNPRPVRRDCGGTYSCSCSNGDIECPYCAVGGIWGDICLMSGSTSVAYNNELYKPEAQCKPRTEDAIVRRPTMSPTPALVPVPEDRAPAPGDGGGGAVPIPSPQGPLFPLGCDASNPFNVRLCLGSQTYCRPDWISCNLLGQHPCSCSASPEITMCSNCQLQTDSELLCMVAGSWTTTTASDGTLQTCGCQYGGNGQAILNCTRVAVEVSGTPLTSPMGIDGIP